MGRDNHPFGLCFRCEYRARYNELKAAGKEPRGPRAECGYLESSSCCCYMYTPVIPPIINQANSEVALNERGIYRGIGGGAGARLRTVGLPHVKSVVKKYGSNYITVLKMGLRELDVVETKVDKEGVPAGAQCTLVEVLEDGVYLAEYADDDGITLAMPTYEDHELELVWKYEAESDIAE